MAELHGAALAGAVGGEAEHSHLGVDAEDLGGLGGLDGNLSQLLGSGENHVALLVQGILVAQVDGAVAHGQLFLAPHQNEAGGDQVSALLGLHQLQSGTDGVGGGVGGAAQQGVGIAHLHQHGAEVVALAQSGAALLGGHLALPQLYHLLDHGVHLGIGQGVQNLQAFNVKAALGSVFLHHIHVAHQNGGQEAVLLQTGGCFQDTGVMALGEHNLAGIGLEGLNHRFKHDNIPPKYFQAQPDFLQLQLYITFRKGATIFSRIFGKFSRKNLLTRGGGCGKIGG